jgi:hypothetical protein
MAKIAYAARGAVRSLIVDLERIPVALNAVAEGLKSFKALSVDKIELKTYCAAVSRTRESRKSSGFPPW